MDNLLLFLIWLTGLITVVKGVTTTDAPRSVSSVLNLAPTNSSVSVTENPRLVTTSSSRVVKMSEIITMVTTAVGVEASATISLGKPRATRSRTAVLTTTIRMRLHNTTTPSYVLPTRGQSTPYKTLVSITSSNIIPHVPPFTSNATRRLTTSQINWRVTSSSMVAAVSSPSSTRTTTTKTKKTTSSMTLFGLTEDGVKYTFLAAIALAGVCLIFSIIICCYYKCKIKRLRKQLEGENATVNANPYRVGDNGCPDVSMYPAHLQLDSFSSDKTESPYDVPEQQETDLEVSYVDVIDGDGSEPRYTDLKREEMTNNRQESPVTPVYSNASEFALVDSNPYQELLTKGREKDPQYTSLIQKDKEPEDDVAV